MKLLQLIGGMGAEHGGPPVAALSACLATRRAGAETTFAFPLDGEPDSALAAVLARLRADGVAIRHFPYATVWGACGRRWGISRGLAGWMKRHGRDYDIIHCHGAWQMVTFLSARRAGNGPALVLTPHESLTDFDLAQSASPVTGLLKKWLRRYYVRRIDLFVLASRLEARDSLPDLVDRPGRIAVLPHAVFDETGEPPAPKAAAPSPGALRLGYLGRLHAKKNVDVILRALPGTAEGLSLSIAGSGPEHSTLKALSVTLGIDHRIAWPGFIDGARKRQFFDEIDVLLMPSDYECFGMAAAEAMIHGVPVITTPDTGIAEIIRAHGGGDIVAADPDSLRTAIENLARDPDRMADLGTRAAAAARQSLSFESYGTAMMRHYEALLAGRKAAGR